MWMGTERVHYTCPSAQVNALREIKTSKLYKFEQYFLNFVYVSQTLLNHFKTYTEKLSKNIVLELRTWFLN